MRLRRGEPLVSEPLIGPNVRPSKASLEKLVARGSSEGRECQVSAVFENLEDGVTIDELVELYDGLTRDQVRAVLDFAARSLETPSGR